MQRFSFLAIARNALTGHSNWQEQWRSPEPKAAYDVVIVGGGGHGLATASCPSTSRLQTLGRCSVFPTPYR